MVIRALRETGFDEDCLYRTKSPAGWKRKEADGLANKPAYLRHICPARMEHVNDLHIARSEAKKQEADRLSPRSISFTSHRVAHAMTNMEQRVQVHYYRRARNTPCLLN